MPSPSRVSVWRQLADKMYVLEQRLNTLISGGGFDGWHAPASLGTNWVTGGAAAGFQPVLYRLTFDGCVEITGMVHNTNAVPAVTIWTMPSGYFNSTNEQRVPITYNNNAGAAVPDALQITTAGAVQLVFAPTAITQEFYLACRYQLH